MIVGTGIDIAEVHRIAATIERFGRRFLERVFTPDEIRYCESKANKAERYAGRFAAKEAAMKAIGTITRKELGEDEAFILAHWTRWGSDGYPIRKAGRRWWVDGMRGRGACPKSFATKRQAAQQWEAFVQSIIDDGAALVRQGF